MHYKSLISFVLCALALLMFTGCDDDYAEVVQPYVGFKLTSTGWERADKKLQIYYAGTVNLGIKDVKTNWHNKLYLVEVGTYLATESFVKTAADKDHRLNLGDGTPLTGDIRFRCNVGRNDTLLFEEILAQIEARPVEGRSYTYVISLKQIYDKFAKMDNRSGSREVLASYPDYENLMKHKADSTAKGLSTKLFVMAHKNFEDNGVPMTLQNAKASNLQMDAKVLDEQNKVAALSLVQAKIDAIGTACKRNGTTYQAYRNGEILKYIADKNPNGWWVNGVNQTPVLGRN